jgi:hypothetical protein
MQHVSFTRAKKIQVLLNLRFTFFCPQLCYMKQQKKIMQPKISKLNAHYFMCVFTYICNFQKKLKLNMNHHTRKLTCMHAAL